MLIQKLGYVALIQNILLNVDANMHPATTQLVFEFLHSDHFSIITL
jgi:hypothetical protein